MAGENYELAPRPGMTASQRKAELEQARFVAVRNLAYITYKKPDGSALLNYQETLGERDRVRDIILQYEIANGLIVNDLGAAPGPAGQVNGAPQMAPQQMAPQQIAPGQGYAQPGPAGVPQQMTPAAAYTQPLGVQPAASPQQAVQATTPQQQDQPEQSQQPTGRRRRGAGGGAPQAGQGGTSVAPPNGTLPGQMAIPMTPAGAGGQQSMAPAYGQPPGQIAPPGAAVGGYGVPVQAAPAQAPAGDVEGLLRTLIAKVDELGRGLTAVSKDLDDQSGLLGKVHLDSLQALAALHHVYASTPGLREALQQKSVQTLDQFRGYLTPSFTGNP